MRGFSACWPRLLLPWFFHALCPRLISPGGRHTDSISTSSHLNRPHAAPPSPRPLPLPDLISKVVSVSTLSCCAGLHVLAEAVWQLQQIMIAAARTRSSWLTVIVDAKTNTWKKASNCSGDRQRQTKTGQGVTLNYHHLHYWIFMWWVMLAF